MNPLCSRRKFIGGMGAMLGSLALRDRLLADVATNPLAARAPHFPTKAKACIFLYMEGGPSHMDTFDPKPELVKRHMQPFTKDSKFVAAMDTGARVLVRSPFQFRETGKSGLWMCEHFDQLARVADDLCIYRGCQVDSVDHPTANFQMNTGNRFSGDAGLGSWVSYGLGTVNENLPSFVVLPEESFPQGGTTNWSNGFLPAAHQGTPLRPKGSPILDLYPPAGTTVAMQRANLDLLAEMNREQLANHPAADELRARLDSYELAFRMQAQVPDLLDLSKEDKRTLDAYGIGREPTDSFGRKCLLARRLIERGVRLVQAWSGGWDSHSLIATAHAQRIRAVDQPMAALIADLKQRGLLDSTLVVWGGEFGRSPDNKARTKDGEFGRDHNAKAMNIVLAGGGVRGGRYVGATDDLGEKAIEVAHPVKDLHVTLLHLLGLDDNKLTYFHGGRFKQLSQTGGDVIKEIVG
ncbi:MAG: DUF1501 domain-containing protein [Chthoniobacteraceae bacterium]